MLRLDKYITWDILTDEANLNLWLVWKKMKHCSLAMRSYLVTQAVSSTVHLIEWVVSSIKTVVSSIERVVSTFDHQTLLLHIDNGTHQEHIDEGVYCTICTLDMVMVLGNCGHPGQKVVAVISM